MHQNHGRSASYLTRALGTRKKFRRIIATHRTGKLTNKKYLLRAFILTLIKDPIARYELIMKYHQNRTLYTRKYALDRPRQMKRIIAFPRSRNKLTLRQLSYSITLHPTLHALERNRSVSLMKLSKKTPIKLQSRTWKT